MKSWLPKTEEDYRKVRGRFIDDQGHEAKPAPGEVPYIIIAGFWGNPRVSPGSLQHKCTICEGLVALDITSQEFVRRDPEQVVLCPNCSLKFSKMTEVLENSPELAEILNRIRNRDG